MERREFIHTAIISALATAMQPTLAFAQSKTGMHKPPRLRAGQTVGLIAPSSNVMENQDIGFAIDILKSFGFKVKTGQHLYARHGYLAGEDQVRAADVNAMFKDPDVDAIFCLRGGYGSPRILPYLDYASIAKHPKVIIGYSDVTALLNAIYTQTGMVTFHGPIAAQNFTDYTLSQFKQVLFDAQAATIAAPPAFETAEGRAERDNRITVITPGVAEGKLIGGNLSLMVKLVGTPYEPDYRGNILILEDVSEAPYRIDGMLTHLKLAGKLQQLAGIAFGKCSDCEIDGNSLSIEQVLNDHLQPLGIPVIRGLMIGHIDDLATIPIGVRARLDTSQPAIQLLESGVS
ncbi:LD-carboxypeptidase [Bowmanella sp. JS7-9]|uniref:S66 peptidase family protein n=1 Tax=Alteromonadaceae TaxID=72275 RepID=UPI0020C36D83|nr:LD-carboxypeptidase [Bowmanella sp. JS7-9]